MNNKFLSICWDEVEKTVKDHGIELDFSEKWFWSKEQIKIPLRVKHNDKHDIFPKRNILVSELINELKNQNQEMGVRIHILDTDNLRIEDKVWRKPTHMEAMYDAIWKIKDPKISHKINMLFQYIQQESEEVLDEEDYRC